MVLGAGIGGILAASALARHYARVLILDRDRIPDRPTVRKGVPQDKHPHILLRRGELAIRALLPGALERLRPRDFTPMNTGKNLRWFHAGVWKARHDPGFDFHMCNRVRLEHTLRAEALTRPGVELLDEHKILDLQLDRPGGRVTGVVVRRRGEHDAEVIPADLVVDSTGRGTRAPMWLEQHGFGEVEVQEVQSNVGYTSRVFHMPGGVDRSRLPIVVFPDAPRSRRAGLVFPLGDNGLIVALAGWCRDYVPRTPEGFLKFARSLDRPELARALLGARPAPGEHAFRARANVWRRYDRMRRWPEGLLVIGDAVSSLNPLYGQGMTIAAVEVQALARTLRSLARRRGDARLEQRGRAHRLQRSFARVIWFPWTLVTSEDLRHAETVGPRPRGLALLQRFASALHELVAYDRHVHERMLEILNLTRGPLSLLSPRILLGLALHRLRGPGLVRVLRHADAPLALSPGGAAAGVSPRRRAPRLARVGAAATPTRAAAAPAMKRPTLTFEQWRAAKRSGKLVQLRRATHIKQLASRAEATVEETQPITPGAGAELDERWGEARLTETG